MSIKVFRASHSLILLFRLSLSLSFCWAKMLCQLNYMARDTVLNTETIHSYWRSTCDCIASRLQWNQMSDGMAWLFIVPFILYISLVSFEVWIYHDILYIVYHWLVLFVPMLLFIIIIVGLALYICVFIYKCVSNVQDL